MPLGRRPSLLDRLLDAFRRDVKVGVVVNTTRGGVVVQVDRRELRRLG